MMTSGCGLVKNIKRVFTSATAGKGIDDLLHAIDGHLAKDPRRRL